MTNKSNVILHPINAVFPMDRAWQLNHFHGGSSKLKPATRIMPREWCNPGMLANAELINDERVQEGRARLDNNIPS